VFPPWSDYADLGVPLPLHFSAPHPDAVGSYWDVYGERVSQVLGIVPLLWQEMVLRRGLEFRADGSLCWTECVVSVARQSGKSVGLLRPLAVVRALLAQEWGVPAFVTHVARNREAARKLLVRPDAVRLAEAAGVVVKAGKGDEAWVWPDGSMWQVFASNGAYGETSSMLFTDEGWDIRPEHYEDALAPSLTEAFRPQEWHTSAADSGCTPFFPGRIAAALSGADPSVMVAVWAAAPDDDPFDPLTWWKASPRWSEQRFARIRKAMYSPSVREQYLNIWPQGSAGLGAEWPAGWSRCARAEPGVAQVVVVEHGAEGVYGVVGGRVDGRVVSCWGLRVGSLAEAVAEVERMSAGGAQVVAGLSVAGAFPGCAKVGVRETKEHSARFAEAVRDGQLAHDHGADVMQESRDAVAVRVDGRQVLSANRSRGPVPVLKGMLWAHMWLSRPQEVALIV
jgi:hypothetical protein